MNLPKVLVGCPTSEHKEYCIEEYAKAVKSLSYKNCGILLVDNSESERYYNKLKGMGFNVIKDKYVESARERITNSRNILREYAIDGGYDFFFSLEQDVIPPKDAVERLLDAKKDAVTGVYFMPYKEDNKMILRPLLYQYIDETKEYLRQLECSEIEGRELLEVGACGLGCILISSRVLSNTKFRVQLEDKPFDDVWFCRDLLRYGHKLFADSKLICKHLVKGMNWRKIKK